MRGKLKAKIIGFKQTDELSLVKKAFLSLPCVSALNFDNYYILPGFCDVHVHFREPGFSYKETILSGSKAAAAGGYTDVCTMPNLNPVPDSLENIKVQQSIIDKDAVINVYPYASITKKQAGSELVDFKSLKDNCIAYSDDGKGIQAKELMLLAMQEAKSLNKMIVAHCEDNSLLFGGYIHKGEYALKNNHLGISSESEYLQIERDIKLAKQTGCKYHVCHISTKESVDLIRKAKADGVDITCETGPHYLILDDSNLIEDGKFKMNPPLRSKEDKLALIEGIKDGTIDMIATDHAPHSFEEKSKGLKNSAFGIVGLETAFSLLYTHLVKKGVISLEKLIDLLVYNPRERFNIKSSNNFTVFKLDEKYNIDSSQFLSKGKATPFDNSEVYAKCYLTVCNDKIVYSNLCSEEK